MADGTASWLLSRLASMEDDQDQMALILEWFSAD